MIKVLIDRDVALAADSCRLDCSEFFEEIPDDNLSRIIESYRIEGAGEGEAPDDMIDCITEACEDCPASVIHVS